MIRSVSGGPVIALILSVGLHVGMFALVPGREGGMIEAGLGEVGTIRLGNSFADIVAGSTGAAEVVPTDQTATSAAVPIVQPAITTKTTTPVIAAPLTQADPVMATPVVPASAVAAPVAEALPSAPDQTVAAIEPAPQAETKPEKKPEKKVETKAQAGSEESARAGTSTGTTDGTATTATNTATGRTDGNAKASNYPGVVMKKLSRTKPDRVKGNGTALVSFTISSNGGVASVSIIKSSGSAAIDKAALALVKRAAPFPTPPAGADRIFSFEFSG